MSEREKEREMGRKTQLNGEKPSATTKTTDVSRTFYLRRSAQVNKLVNFFFFFSSSRKRVEKGEGGAYLGEGGPYLGEGGSRKLIFDGS